MQQLIRLFWEICLLRKGPQDVPSAVVLFWLLFLIGFVVDVFMAVNFVDFQPALFLVLANILVLFGMVISLLAMFRYKNRIIQTLTTLIGAGLVFSFLRMPLLFVFKSYPDSAGIFGIMEIFLLIWNLLVVAHILRHALSTELFVAGMLSFGYFMVSYQLVDYFIPQAS